MAKLAASRLRPCVASCNRRLHVHLAHPKDQYYDIYLTHILSNWSRPNNQSHNPCTHRTLICLDLLLVRGRGGTFFFVQKPKGTVATVFQEPKPGPEPSLSAKTAIQSNLSGDTSSVEAQQNLLRTKRLF